MVLDRIIQIFSKDHSNYYCGFHCTCIKKVKKINYIAEITLPSKSAYSIQVMKMCDAFSLEGYETKLFTFGRKGKAIHKYYNCKKKFKIEDLKISSNTFINRLIFSLKL